MTKGLTGSRWVSMLLSALLSAFCCLSVLALMSFTQKRDVEREKPVLEIRNIVQAPPPPPPKRETVKREIKKLVIPTLAKSTSQSEVFLEIAPIDVPMELEFNPDLKMNHEASFEMDVQVEASVALKTVFEFEELSEPPRVLHYGGFRYTFPKDLLRRGIRRGEVKLLIEIDTEGKAKVLAVQSASHPELVPIAKRLVAMSRYTIPTVEGRAVTTEGVWPVVLEAPN